jgi:mRNA-degrading endonuclease toxin of MazEF toxin-antitoxin module
MIGYPDVEEYLAWVKHKAELKFNPQAKTFPILYNCLYWAFLGCNIGSEENKHRPVVITRTHKNSSLITIIPLTSKRLNDKYSFHVDLEALDSTALVEQMRTIDNKRLDKPIFKRNKIVSISENDWIAIDAQVRREYLLCKPAEK